MSLPLLFFHGNAFASALLKEQKISTLPGGGFGETTRPYVRITMAQPIDVLMIAFDRIDKFVAQYRARKDEI